MSGVADTGVLGRDLLPVAQFGYDGGRQLAPLFDRSPGADVGAENCDRGVRLGPPQCEGGVVPDRHADVIRPAIHGLRVTVRRPAGERPDVALVERLDRLELQV